MVGPVNTIRIDREKLKSGINTYRIQVDRKSIQDHFESALAEVLGHNMTWSGKNHAIVNGLSLRRSGIGSGRFAIFNCTCGSGAECAGLEQTIEVEHTGEFIIWKYRAPRHKTERSEKVFTFRFHKPQYLEQLNNVANTDDLKGLPGYGAV